METSVGRAMQRLARSMGQYLAVSPSSTNSVSQFCARTFVAAFLALSLTEIRR